MASKMLATQALAHRHGGVRLCVRRGNSRSCSCSSFRGDQGTAIRAGQQLCRLNMVACLLCRAPHRRWGASGPSAAQFRRPSLSCPAMVPALCSSCLPSIAAYDHPLLPASASRHKGRTVLQHCPAALPCSTVLQHCLVATTCGNVLWHRAEAVAALDCSISNCQGLCIQEQLHLHNLRDGCRAPTLHGSNRCVSTCCL